MKLKWELTGLDDYYNALQAAGKNINTVSREGLAEAGRMLQSAMVARCPSDKLKPYIKIYTPSVEGTYNYVAVGYVHDLAYTPADIAVAANSVEFGSVHNAPMPHIRPAVSAMRSAVNNLIAAKLKAAGLIDP
jgi:hypothetical protein